MTRPTLLMFLLTLLLVLPACNLPLPIQPQPTATGVPPTAEIAVATEPPPATDTAAPPRATTASTDVPTSATSAPTATERPTATAEPSATTAPTATVEPSATAGPSLTDENSTLAALQATEIQPRDLYNLAVRFGVISPNTPRLASETDPGYEVGDTLTFNVSNLITDEDRQVPATLRAQTAHASWWFEDGIDIDQDDIEESAAVFEEQTYPTNRALFGSEWSPGIDGDGRVHVFVGDVAGVGGYFSSADEFPQVINPDSNEKEIFYINIYNARPGTAYFDGILAHEFQHMIHWNTDRNEDLWLNEGLSELAAYVNGFTVGSNLNTYLADPDITVTRWQEQTGPYYGSAYAFVRYLYETYGAEAITALVRESADGGTGIEAVTGQSFDTIFAEWTAANLAGDYIEQATAGFINYTARLETFPIVLDETVNQYGTDYYQIEPGDAPLTIEVKGAPDVPLLPIEAHSGSWMLWSNRGDDGYSYASRAFDLSGTDAATLNYWTWYSIEEDYDYAYVGVSVDGGTTWELLPTDETTSDDPNGNSLGPAYTGSSGSWIEQSVDLTPYAGQEILVGFHMVTDDALNETGMVIDDVIIPEIGYREDFEDGAEGWEQVGWARVDNRVPQRFLVQAVVYRGDAVQTEEIVLDETGNGTLTIDPDADEDITEVVLIVTGATEYTTEEATYSVRVREQ